MEPLKDFNIGNLFFRVKGEATAKTTLYVQITVRGSCFDVPLRVQSYHKKKGNTIRWESIVYGEGPIIH